MSGFDRPADIAHFDERQFDVQALMARHFEVDVAVVAKVERGEQKGGRGYGGLFPVSLPQSIAHFQKG